MQQLKNRLNIMQNYEIDISITQNPHNFALSDLFKMAARINKKRQFLFVSTVLGKHLAVRPQIPLLTGTLLAMMYYRRVVDEEINGIEKIVYALKERNGQDALQPNLELPEETLFIGFAETATALGHAVFNTFLSNATYIHTTREIIPDIEPFVTFEEEHSHATSHRIYTLEPEKLLQAKRIVLIDDEITTGNTVVNIIASLREKFPLVKHYTVLSILDWRSEQQQRIFKQLENQWNISIDFIAIMCGNFSCNGTPLLPSEHVGLTKNMTQDMELISIKEPIDRKYYRSIAENGLENSQPYMLATGRFMLTSEQHLKQKDEIMVIANQLKKLRTDGPLLVIGTGEFMYVPLQIAAHLGEGVYFQSTTRSPIYCTDDTEYTITEKIAFECPENNGIENYLYNVQSHPYTELFLIVERIASREVILQSVQALQSVIKAKIYVICMHELEVESWA